MKDFKEYIQQLTIEVSGFFRYYLDMKAAHKKEARTAITVGISLVFVITIVFLSLNVYRLEKKVNRVNSDFRKIESSQQNFESNFTETLFNEHLALIEKQRVKNELDSLKGEFETLKNDSETNELVQINAIFTLYEELEAKVDRNNQVEIESINAKEKTSEWGSLLISKDFETLRGDLEAMNANLDSIYSDYIESLPPTTPIGGGEGYSYNTVATEKGSFGVYLIKLPLSEYTVKTVSAGDSNCSDNCPTKTLGDFVNDSGAVAGINGSYFCPPDYSSCSGKVNSFDYAFYSSNKGKWINKDALTWFDTGMIVFNGHSYSFYKKTSEYDGGSVTAAISNYPSLLKNGDVVVNTDILTSYQRDVKGTRGAIGVGEDNIYLALITNATVIDAAYAMKSLGATHALNIDGGGSSAMYINGGYVVGPGRSLPNAIVLVK